MAELELLEGDVAEAVAALKREEGGDLLVIGSSIAHSAATAPAPTNAGCFLTQPRKRFLKAARTSSILT
jgi:nucleotide-binding universal stress UspA family protein